VKKTPEALDRIADKVLAYRPEDKQRKPKRKRRAKKSTKG